MLVVVVKSDVLGSPASRYAGDRNLRMECETEGKGNKDEGAKGLNLEYMRWMHNRMGIQ